jgi:hypothetical protein
MAAGRPALAGGATRMNALPRTSRAQQALDCGDEFGRRNVVVLISEGACSWLRYSCEPEGGTAVWTGV